MTKLSLLIALLFYPPAEGETLALDELHIQEFHDAAYCDGRVLVSYSHAIMDQRLGLFDFSTQKVRLLRDGRIKAFIPILTSHANGFVLFSRVGEGKAFFLDGNGGFLHVERLAEFEGWDDAFQLDQASRLSGNEYLATVHNLTDEQLFLLRLDLSARQIHVLYNERLDFDIMPYWTAVGERWLKIHPETGLIEQVDKPSLRTTAVVRPGQPLIDRRKHALRLAKRRRYSPYLLIPISCAGRMSFRYTVFHDAAGNLLKRPYFKALLQTSDNPPTYELRESMPLAVHDGWRLMYRPESGNHHLTLERVE